MQIDTRASGQLGAIVTRFDARRASEPDIQALRRAMYEHKLLVLRDQAVDEQEYLAFARRLGTPQIYLQAHYRHPDYPEIFVSSNITEDGKKIGVAGTGQYWHTDYQFMPAPLSTTLVYPRVLPSSRRETYYIDMARVYGRLPARLRRLVDGRCAIHEAKWRYKVTAEDVDRALVDILRSVEERAPAVVHPAVIVHPVTREMSLYVSSGFTTGVEGFGPDEGACVLAELFAFIERDEHIHTHVWQPGDILYWDNRALIHRASPAPRDEPNKSYRIGVYDGLPFYLRPEVFPRASEQTGMFGHA